MSSNKQSSVDVILNLLVEKGYAGLLDEDEIEQAKAIHKEEIMEAHYAPKYGCFSEQYYNETFGGEK